MLIRAAAHTCARVTVAVLGSSLETLPLDVRVECLREVHAADGNVTVVADVDDHPIDYQDAQVWDLHMGTIRAVVAQATDDPVDAVFTSETYGDEMARRLGARSVCLDLPRELAPVSGTAVRADPAAHWDQLAPRLRAWLTRRVVLVGAESTGKTTLALRIVESLVCRGGAFAACTWVPEWARVYALDKLVAARAAALLEGRAPARPEDLSWAAPEFETIAREQSVREEAAARRGGPVLVCDTDAFATSLWEERYLGRTSAATEALARTARPHLYLLSDLEGTPFVQDGTRDGESVRAWMSRRFGERLHAEGREYLWLRGTLEERRTAALRAIDDLLAAGWGLADPTLATARPVPRTSGRS
jgi:HTH-type transcriptional regulator, transcriptional repressor of NAD biosynthesis genes